MWPAGYPNFPMLQQLHTESTGRRVTISCLVSDLEFCWQLREAGTGTDIDVEVALPDREAHRLETQEAVVAASIERLAALAEANDHVSVAGCGDAERVRHVAAQAATDT